MSKPTKFESYTFGDDALFEALATYADADIPSGTTVHVLNAEGEEITFAKLVIGEEK